MHQQSHSRQKIDFSPIVGVIKNKAFRRKKALQVHAELTDLTLETFLDNYII